MVQKNVIELQYGPTDEMLADIFTKALPSAQFVKLRSLIGVVSR
jgi:hypothetical protein